MDIYGRRQRNEWNVIFMCSPSKIEDITYRVLRILKEVDLIAAEDTRNSMSSESSFEVKTSNDQLPRV